MSIFDTHHLTPKIVKNYKKGQEERSISPLHFTFHFSFAIRHSILLNFHAIIVVPRSDSCSYLTSIMVSIYYGYTHTVRVQFCFLQPRYLEFKVSQSKEQFGQAHDLLYNHLPLRDTIQS